MDTPHINDLHSIGGQTIEIPVHGLPINPLHMEFIFLTETEQTYHIESAKNDMEALKQYVAYYACGNNKPFNILCDSGQMDMAELIKYANQYLLCNHNAIHAIYTLGPQVYCQNTDQG